MRRARARPRLTGKAGAATGAIGGKDWALRSPSTLNAALPYVPRAGARINCDIQVYNPTLHDLVTTPRRHANIASHLKIANTHGRMLGAFPCRLWRSHSGLAGSTRILPRASRRCRAPNTLSCSDASSIPPPWRAPRRSLHAGACIHMRCRSPMAGAGAELRRAVQGTSSRGRCRACRRGKPAPEPCHRAAEGTRPRKELRLGARPRQAERVARNAGAAVAA